uniref:NADH-ubiquinone oxidoreductase chain 6 n=1 Tax=Jebusaea hammerschmidtii TaxID=2233810 RepID=A0A8E8GS59_9CUCU|nr:NADH dehydrogenase subunit 6 [Jebusaea hammerschmidtii]
MLLLIIILSVMFLFLNHPLSLGLMLLIQTLLISLLTGMMNYNFWFSYILFLVMVGGMLVLFIYMTSVASNEKFKLSNKLLIPITMLIMMMVMMTLIDQLPLNTMFTSQDLNISSNNNLSASKYISSLEYNLMAMIITYLLICLIMVVKITNIKYGPLRQMF